MGLFNLFKKKEKTYICARCKKEITDAESKWIGSHRFCSDCAAPPKNVNMAPKQAVDNSITTKTIKVNTISTALQKEAEEAGYQAYMDYARGSLTPEEAYLSRGFVKDEDGKWVYGKLVTINDTIKPKEKPCEPIEIKNTIIKEIKPANGAAFSFEKTAIIIEIVQAEGKEFVRIIDYDCCSGANGRPLYSLFEYYYKTDDVELTNISATNYKSKIKGNAEYQYKEFDCGVRY